LLSRCILATVASGDVRIGAIEKVTLKGDAEELFNGFSIFRAFETLPHAEKNLVEPRKLRSETQ
jgi:hypothetical protein